MQKPRVKTSDIALAILEKIAFSEEPLNQVQIAGEMGMVKSAAHKHLFTLEEAGWISRDRITGRYGLGPKAWLVGQRATHVKDLATSADSLMRETRNKTGLTVVLSSFNKRTLNVISTLPGTHSIEIGVRQGSKLALHGSAQGQAVLAFSTPELLDEVCNGELVVLTPKTLTDPEVLRKRIEEIAHRGYSSAPEETILGVNSIAAPIFDHRGNVVASVALLGSIQHIPATPDEEHVKEIIALSRSISRTQGHQIS